MTWDESCISRSTPTTWIGRPRSNTELFGWQITKWDGPFEYRMIVTGPDGTPGINGGMVKRPMPASGAAGVAAFVCTVDVESVDQSVEKGTALGGVVALPKMPIPGVGWLAYLQDSEGNTFGVMQADPSAG